MTRNLKSEYRDNEGQEDIIQALSWGGAGLIVWMLLIYIL